MLDLFRRRKQQSEDKIDESLKKTRQGFFSQIKRLFETDDVTDETWDDLEALLIQADVGVATAHAVLERVQERALTERLTRASQVEEALEQELTAILRHGEATPDGVLAEPVHVVLVIGVNGTGKTTTIGKLARLYADSGQRVVIGAGDTFRAAASDQVAIWAERAGAELIAHQPGADPGAVAYDALQAARARGARILIVDTAGRLHTKFNLMEELRKVKRVLQKQDASAPHETLLVMDATTGQNGLQQARSFAEAVGVTGVVLTKLDGTAKGGIAFAITQELGLPIRYVGTGEKLDDLADFDAAAFVRALFQR